MGRHNIFKTTPLAKKKKKKKYTHKNTISHISNARYQHPEEGLEVADPQVRGCFLCTYVVHRLAMLGEEIIQSCKKKKKKNVFYTSWPSSQYVGSTAMNI